MDFWIEIIVIISLVILLINLKRIYFLIKSFNLIFKSYLKSRFPAVTWRFFACSQNNNKEANYLLWLCNEIKVEKSFIEFGFEPYEFNSVNLVKNGFKGLIIDGGELNCKLANHIFGKLNFNVKALCHWISIDNLDPIINFVSDLKGKIGVLNIDVDGNDYWILRELLKKIKPEVVCVEHNASFGLRSISVPYKLNFNRHNEDKSGWYHGASITAFYKLLSSDYELVKNICGLNLVFVRKNKMKSMLKPLVCEESFSEPILRNKWSGTDTKQQWERIKNLRFEIID